MLNSHERQTGVQDASLHEILLLFFFFQLNNCQILRVIFVSIVIQSEKNPSDLQEIKLQTRMLIFSINSKKLNSSSPLTGLAATLVADAAEYSKKEPNDNRMDDFGAPSTKTILLTLMVMCLDVVTTSCICRNPAFLPPKDGSCLL